MRMVLLALLLAGFPAIAIDTEADSSANEAARARPTGPLSAAEAKFQGTWKGGYTIVIEGREFCADTQPGEWYEGYVVIRADEEPAQIDFVILVQSGEPNGNASEGIFRWDGDTVVVVAPPPGNARPRGFDVDEEGVVVELRLKRDGQSRHPAAHCLNERAGTTGPRYVRSVSGVTASIRAAFFTRAVPWQPM